MTLASFLEGQFREKLFLGRTTGQIPEVEDENRERWEEESGHQRAAGTNVFSVA
jgi:hypothetical protein